MAVEDPEFERAFRGAIQYALHSGFSEILELTPVQEGALLRFMKREDVFEALPTGCGKYLIFQLVPKVSLYLHDRGFSYPKAAIVLVICPLNALIPGGGVLPYMGHIGMCRCEGYGFQAVYSGIGYINQSVWV